MLSIADVLENFRDDDDGNLICYPGESHRGVSDMFNVYRYTQIAFPGEKILKEAKTFLEEYLKNCVKEKKINDKWSLKKSLEKEVILLCKCLG
jgi:ent-copalyl diphosphate synthase